MVVDSPSCQMSDSRSAKRLKIIVGVDYGTTFTGISYATSDKTSIDDIDVIRTWPGDGRPVEGNWKTPTVIAYESENRRTRRNLWGYEVRRDMVSCSWTKLLLDRSAETAEFDDPSLRDTTGSALFHIPEGKNAQMVCQDFLTEVYRFVVRNLKNRITPEVFDMTPMECYVTVPAIWTDRARTATWEAAKAAGFGSRSFDKIRMIPEPEAAAVAALRKDLRPGSVNAVQAGDNVLILDCGGGTVDITTYTIRKTFPSLGFDELCVGIGGKCGSTYIDRNFLELMADRFGPAFESVPLRRRGPGSEFMASFEKAKQNFGTSDQYYGTDDEDTESYEIGPIHMEGEFDEEQYDPEQGAVILSRMDMERIFNPVIRDVLRLLKWQIERVSSMKGKKINTIVLVGGFGNSDYLKNELDTWCADRQIKCIRPAFCQAAVVRGAAIRGLEGVMPCTVICRRHYGISCGRPFRPGIDDEKHLYYDAWDNEPYCRGRISWLIDKGEELSESTYKSASISRTHAPGDSDIFKVKLYASNLDSAPERIDEPGAVPIGKITVDFTNVNKSIFRKRKAASGGIEYKLKYDVAVDFRADEGVLQCFCIADGKRIGTTTINYEDLIS